MGSHRDYPTVRGWCCHSSEYIMQVRWFLRRSVQQAPPLSFPIACKSVCWGGIVRCALWTGLARAATALLGSLSACACVSGILSVGMGLQQGFETWAVLREPYFFEQTWYYALISAPELFWHVHVRQKWPNNWPHFQELTFRNAAWDLVLSFPHCQALICHRRCCSGGIAEYWVSPKSLTSECKYRTQKGGIH